MSEKIDMCREGVEASAERDLRRFRYVGREPLDCRMREHRARLVGIDSAHARRGKSLMLERDKSTMIGM